MTDPARTNTLRAKAIEHLEVALQITREIDSATAGSMIEMALYNLRADARPDRPQFPRAG